jgi:Tol biopolymer transport system component
MSHSSRPRALTALVSVVLALAPLLPGGAEAIAVFGPANSRGYWFVAADGGIFSFGDAAFQGSTGNLRLNKPIVGMAPTPTGKGYWFVAADGGIFSFGDANFYGSTGNLKLNRPIVGMAPTPTGKGYWFVAADGGIFSFGDANFYGSTGNLRLNKPIVGMAATPTGKGYWFVASDGGIFSFGDATFYGSAGGQTLRSGIVGMSATPTGKGYWFVAADGGIYSFGDATFFGSMGGRPLQSPVVGMAPTAGGGGYWLAAADGGVFTFGDATFLGSMGGRRLNSPIVGMAPTGGTTGPAAPGGGPTTTTQPPTGTTPPGGGGQPTTTPPIVPSGTAYWGSPGTTTLLDRGTARGVDGGAYRPWMSGDGRYVAFDSDYDKVIPSGDTNGIRDVFVYDSLEQTYTRVSVASGGAQATGGTKSWRPTISADGRYVAFWSDATNLVSNDTNGTFDAFVHDRQTGTTTRVSVGPNGAQANGQSARPVISRDGRYVAFESDATNLIGPVGAGGGLLGGLAGGDSNNATDVFVYEMASGTVSPVSVGENGAQGDQESSGPSISADGQKIAFHSNASLVSGDTNGVSDVYLRDLGTGKTTRVSIAADGTGANKSSRSPSISADGRFVSFDTRATNLGPADGDGRDDVYVKDLQTGAVEQASVSSDGKGGRGGSLGSKDSSISGDGRFVAFWSDATSLVPGDTNGWPDVFVHDRQTGATTRVSVSTTGAQGDDDSFSPAMSVDGRYVAFDSKANTLATGGAPDKQDVFVHAL